MDFDYVTHFEIFPLDLLKLACLSIGGKNTTIVFLSIGLMALQIFKQVLYTTHYYDEKQGQ
jgi:hypothetical protein